MNVYVWTNSLKNAYIGEYHTLEYDFTTQNVLTFQWQWDNSFTYWYSAWNWYYTVKNSYYQWEAIWTLPSAAYVNDVKKVTLKGSAQSAVCSFVFVNGNWYNSSTMTWIRWWVSSWWPSQWGIHCIRNWNNTRPWSNMTFPTWEFQFQIDLEQWVLNYWTYVINLNSDFISAFKASRANGSMRIWIINWNYNVWSNSYYTYLKKCIIEY